MSDDSPERIGTAISDWAIWDQGRCTWFGAVPRDPYRGGADPVTYRPMGPDLYGGTSGVAVFLARLAAVRSDETARRTAVGALDHALSSVEAVPPDARFGLYAGWPGIALSAVWAGETLGEPEWIERGIDLLQRLDGEERAGEFDVTGGSAGATAVCALLSRRYPDAELLERGCRLGDHLLENARVEQNGGISWAMRDETGPALTGFAHGAAGVSWALLELYEAAGDAAYRDTALRAIDYERYWFDEQSRNWADLRANGLGAHQQSTAAADHPQAVFWCHGAPGIALSRLRAWEVIGEESLRAEAELALVTTQMGLSDTLRAIDSSPSLCHGVAGLADILIRCQSLRTERTDDLLAWAVQMLAERYAPAIISGEREGDESDTPGLMLGLAGLGDLLLRGADGPWPTPLLPQGNETVNLSRP